MSHLVQQLPVMEPSPCVRPVCLDQLLHVSLDVLHSVEIVHVGGWLLIVTGA